MYLYSRVQTTIFLLVLYSFFYMRVMMFHFEIFDHMIDLYRGHVFPLSILHIIFIPVYVFMRVSVKTYFLLFKLLIHLNRGYPLCICAPAAYTFNIPSANWWRKTIRIEKKKPMQHFFIHFSSNFSFLYSLNFFLFLPKCKEEINTLISRCWHKQKRTHQMTAERTSLEKRMEEHFLYTFFTFFLPDDNRKNEK